MTAIARANGWRGFENIGERERGGWRYRCDGMPSLWGCCEELVVTRRLARVGIKSTGWLVTYGKCFPDETADDKHGNDLDVVLTFCPSCAVVLKEQEAASALPGVRGNDAEEAMG